jgi:hypothetical protein
MTPRRLVPAAMDEEVEVKLRLMPPSLDFAGAGSTSAGADMGHGVDLDL